MGMICSFSLSPFLFVYVSYFTLPCFEALSLSLSLSLSHSSPLLVYSLLWFYVTSIIVAGILLLEKDEQEMSKREKGRGRESKRREKVQRVEHRRVQMKCDLQPFASN